MKQVKVPPVYSERLGFRRGFGTDGEFVVREDGLKVRYLTNDEKRYLLGYAGALEDLNEAEKILSSARKRLDEYFDKSVGEVSDV